MFFGLDSKFLLPKKREPVSPVAVSEEQIGELTSEILVKLWLAENQNRILHRENIQLRRKLGQVQDTGYHFLHVRMDCANQKRHVDCELQRIRKESRRKQFQNAKLRTDLCGLRRELVDEYYEVVAFNQKISAVTTNCNAMTQCNIELTSDIASLGDDIQKLKLKASQLKEELHTLLQQTTFNNGAIDTSLISENTFHLGKDHALFLINNID